MDLNAVLPWKFMILGLLKTLSNIFMEIFNIFPLPFKNKNKCVL